MSQETDRLLHRINNQVPYCYSGRDGELQPVSSRVETWTLICQRVERGEITDVNVRQLEGRLTRIKNTLSLQRGDAKDKRFYLKNIYTIAEKILLEATT